jgi:hypothetical protein
MKETHFKWQTAGQTISIAVRMYPLGITLVSGQVLLVQVKTLRFIVLLLAFGQSVPELLRV